MRTENALRTLLPLVLMLLIGYWDGWPVAAFLTGAVVIMTLVFMKLFW